MIGRKAIVLWGVLIVAAAVGCSDSRRESWDVTPFDMNERYEQAKRHAGAGAELIGLSVKKVRSDGSLDLEAKYESRGEYLFVRPVLPEAAKSVEEGPIGSGTKQPKPKPRRLGYGKIKIEIRYIAGKRRHRHPNKFIHTSFKTWADSFDELPTMLPKPACTFASLWKTAEANGVPSNAVADIEYSQAGYLFTIEEISVDMRFDAQCQPVGLLKVEVTNRRHERNYFTLTLDGKQMGDVDLWNHEGRVEYLVPVGQHTVSVTHPRLGTRTQETKVELGVVKPVVLEYK